jgi:hypothetical protein
MKKIFLLTLAFLVLTGCALVNFTPYESDTVFVGKGGTKEIVEGMELWTQGEPPRKYKLLGVIEDERTDGPSARDSFHKDIVKWARNSGGDAIIQLSEESKIEGYDINFESSSEFRTNRSLFAVIKYVE